MFGTIELCTGGLEMILFNFSFSSFAEVVWISFRLQGVILFGLELAADIMTGTIAATGGAQSVVGGC